MEFYSAIKITIKPSKTLMNVKCILLSKRIHCEKSMYCMISIIYHSGRGKIIGSQKISVSKVGGWEGESWKGRA